MKNALILVLVFSGLNAFAAESKVLLSATSVSMFDLKNGGVTTELRDDGYAYRKIGTHHYRKIAKLQSDEQLQQVIAAIEALPVSGKVAQPKYDCGGDGGTSYVVYGDKFEGGSLSIGFEECELQVLTKKSSSAKALIALINSVK